MPTTKQRKPRVSNELLLAKIQELTEQVQELTNGRL